MKRLPWKYLAGFFDGEGCFDLQISYGKYIRPKARIALAENCKYILENIQNTYGGSLLKRELSNKNSCWQDAYSWELTGYDKTLYFLNNLVKHLIIKKEQAKFILWLGREIRGKQVSDTIRQSVKFELSLMKKDPHRLSDRAVQKIELMLQSEQL